MFLTDFQLSFTDTMKVQNAQQQLLNLRMKPGALDDYISTFEHLRMMAGWGADDAGTMMLFKTGLTPGLHRAVLEKMTPLPTTLRDWIESARKQYELWAQIKASIKGSYLRPTDVSAVESQRWRQTLGKKGAPPKYEAMDLDAV
jgi:hypothetical protein